MSPAARVCPARSDLRGRPSGPCGGSEEPWEAAFPAPGKLSGPRASPEPGPYLEHSEDGGREGVKVGGWRLIFKVEPEKNEMS